MNSTTIRSSDADRAEVVERISAATAEGRLGFDESEQRISAAYQARYGAELDALVADLPAPARREKRRRPRVALIVALIVSGVVIAATLHHAPFFWPLIPVAFLLLRFGYFRRGLAARGDQHV